MDLGTLGSTYSEAYSINNREEVAGQGKTASGGGHASLWTAQSGIQDLGTLGSEYSRAAGINNRGQVVGQCATASGEPRAWLRP